MIYFDAAYIAKCYLNEPDADRVREVAYGADGLASCELARLLFTLDARQHGARAEGHLAAYLARNETLPCRIAQ